MFRFTIRDVLWLMAVVALAVGWWLDHREQSIRNNELKLELQFVKAHLDMRMERAALSESVRKLDERSLPVIADPLSHQ